MTVPVRTSRVSTSVDTVSAPTRSARTGAAKRAYDKRQQRARSHDTESASVRSERSIAGRIPFVTTIIGLLAVGLASALLLSTRAAEESYQLSAERAVNQKLTEQAAALERDVETANSAPELARRAKELGMIPTKDVPKLLVQPDGVVQVIGTPAPASGAPAPDFGITSPSATSTGSAAGTPGTSTTGTGSEALTPVTRGGTATTTPAPSTTAPSTTAAPTPAAASPAPAEPAAPAAPAAPAGEQQVPVAGGAR